MNKTKLLAVAAGFLAVAGLTTAGNVYIGSQKVGTYDGNVTVTGTGDLRLPSNTTIDGTDTGGETASCGSFATEANTSTGCRCWSGYEYDGGGSASVVPQNTDCTAVESGGSTGGDTSSPANCDGVGTVGSTWTRDTSITRFSSFAPSSGQPEKFTINRNEYQAIEFTTGSSNTGKVSFDRHTHVEDAKKTVAISECPGDFANTIPSSLCRRTSQALAIYYNTEEPKSWDCELEPNRTYYLNIAYGQGTGNSLDNSCPDSRCGGIWTFYH